MTTTNNYKVTQKKDKMTRKRIKIERETQVDQKQLYLQREHNTVVTIQRKRGINSLFWLTLSVLMRTLSEKALMDRLHATCE